MLFFYLVITAGAEGEKVLSSGRRNIAADLEIQIPQSCFHLHISFLAERAHDAVHTQKKKKKHTAVFSSAHILACRESA